MLQERGVRRPTDSPSGPTTSSWLKADDSTIEIDVAKAIKALNMPAPTKAILNLESPQESDTPSSSSSSISPHDPALPSDWPSGIDHAQYVEWDDADLEIPHLLGDWGEHPSLQQIWALLLVDAVLYSDEDQCLQGRVVVVYDRSRSRDCFAEKVGGPSSLPTKGHRYRRIGVTSMVTKMYGVRYVTIGTKKMNAILTLAERKGSSKMTFGLSDGSDFQPHPMTRIFLSKTAIDEAKRHTEEMREAPAAMPKQDVMTVQPKAKVPCLAISKVLDVFGKDDEVGILSNDKLDDAQREVARVLRSSISTANQKVFAPTASREYQSDAVKLSGDEDWEGIGDGFTTMDKRAAPPARHCYTLMPIFMFMLDENDIQRHL
ncbi:MAG: hypothetical protein J3Q66DRAFT_441414 [Benniella sp.]|nr:MAG: hypothetical protein J3Q66DRAFT_441414 [Benniella sp.]